MTGRTRALLAVARFWWVEFKYRPWWVHVLTGAVLGLLVAVLAC